MAENKVVHAAQRAAFSVAIDAAIKAVRGKGTEHMAEEAVKLINLAEPLLSKRYKASAFDAARKFVQDPNGKWMEYAYRAINEIDPHILKMNVLNLGYEGMFSGYNYVMELRKKYDCNMPWILLFDPTASCNLHCKGCWAAEYGKTLNLTYEEMDKLVTEGEELGIHWYVRRLTMPMRQLPEAFSSSVQLGCTGREGRGRFKLTGVQGTGPFAHESEAHGAGGYGKIAHGVRCSAHADSGQEAQSLAGPQDTATGPPLCARAHGQVPAGPAASSTQRSSPSSISERTGQLRGFSGNIASNFPAGTSAKNFFQSFRTFPCPAYAPPILQEKSTGHQQTCFPFRSGYGSTPSAHRAPSPPSHLL